MLLSGPQWDTYLRDSTALILEPPFVPSPSDSGVDGPPPESPLPLPCQWSPLCCRVLAPYPLCLVNTPHLSPLILHNLDGWFQPFFLHCLLRSPPQTSSPIPLLLLVVALSLQKNLMPFNTNDTIIAFNVDPPITSDRTVLSTCVPAATLQPLGTSN